MKALQFFIALPALAFALAAIGGPRSADWTVPRAYTNGAGKVFLYRWSEPKSVVSGERYPLVMLFHWLFAQRKDAPAK